MASSQRGGHAAHSHTPFRLCVSVRVCLCIYILLGWDVFGSVKASVDLSVCGRERKRERVKESVDIETHSAHNRRCGDFIRKKCTPSHCSTSVDDGAHRN